MIKKVLKSMTNGLVLKLIALLIAFIIWLFVTNSNNPVRSMTIQNVPINIVNESSIADIGKVVEPVGSDTVTVKVTERRSILNRLGRNNFYVEADLENINELESVPLTVTCDNPAVTWDEIAITPSSLKVNIEDVVEQTFVVSVVASGEVGEGYAVGRTEVLPGKNILIDGPESLVNIIGQVIAPISVSGLAEDTELTSTLRVYDKNGSEFTEGQMSRLEFKTADGTVLEERSLQVLVYLWELRSDIPVKVDTYGEPAAGFMVSSVTVLPETITLAGTAEAFENMGDALLLADAISVEGVWEDFEEEEDLSNTLESIEDMKLPADADSLVTVQVHIEKTGYSTLDIMLSDISMQNKPENRKLVFTPADKIAVGVKADDPEAGLITADMIEAEMDLAACRVPGNYEIPVSITLPEGYSLRDPVYIKVSSSDSTSEDQQQEITAVKSDEEETE